MLQVPGAGAARRGAAALVLVVVGSTLAGCGGDSAGDAAAYDAELREFSGEHAVENEVVDIPGGDRFSAGSPDGHDVVVQRYDADAGGWSEPRTVHTEPRLWTHELSVSHADGTVAVDVDFWEEEVLDDDYAPRTTVGLVCPDARCTPGASSGEQLGSVSLANDGDYAVFRRGDGKYAVWDGGTAWSTESLDLPGDEADVELGPDGTVVAVTGTQEGPSCRYTLYRSEPRSFELVEEVTSQPRQVGDDDCDPVLDEVADDRVTLWLEATSGSVEFALDDGSWQEVAPPPSYLTVADTGGRSTLAPVFARQGPDRVVLYSPDLRTLWSQSWTVYTKAWTEPSQVANLPDGLHCRRGRVATVGTIDGFFAELDCFDGADEGVDRAVDPDYTVALRSWNGMVWLGGVVRDAGRFADTGLGVLVAGRPAVLVDMETGEADEVPLPFPAPDQDPFVASADGWLVRVAPREAGGRCEATVHSAASPEAEDWEAGPSFEVPSGRAGCPRLDAVLRPDLSVVVGDGRGWQAVLRRSGSGWRVAR